MRFLRCSFPAWRRTLCGLGPACWGGRPVLSSSIAQSGAGRIGEEPMNTSTSLILLWINSLSQLIAAIAAMIAVLRRGR